MKKTLVALTVAAFAASASAVTVFDNEGSKIEFDGSLRLAIEKNHVKVKNGESKTGHSYLRNDGTRFGIRTKHTLGENGLFALSRLEFRFNGNAKESDGFGDLYAHRAYVGLGHKAYGEVTFGRQVTIMDDVHKSGFDELYGASTNLGTVDGKSVIRYDYKGIEGLQVGVNYNFATARDKDADGKFTEVQAGKAKNGYGIGATYTFNVAEGQKVSLGVGYTRDNFVTDNEELAKAYSYADATDGYKVKNVDAQVSRKKGRHYKDAWTVGAAYQINDFTVAIDGSQAYDKNSGVNTRTSVVGVGAKYDVTPAVNVYGGYGYTHKRVKGETGADKTHQAYLGAGYQVHKSVYTFLETGLERDPEAKTTESKIGAGLRVYW